MNKHLPKPSFPKYKVQMAREYNMPVRAFNTKLAQVGIELARGRIMPDDQLRIYSALGKPIFVWIDQRTCVPYIDDTE